MACYCGSTMRAPTWNFSGLIQLATQLKYRSLLSGILYLRLSPVVRYFLLRRPTPMTVRAAMSPALTNDTKATHLAIMPNVQ